MRKKVLKKISKKVNKSFSVLFGNKVTIKGQDKPFITTHFKVIEDVSYLGHEVDGKEYWYLADDLELYKSKATFYLYVENDGRLLPDVYDARGISPNGYIEFDVSEIGDSYHRVEGVSVELTVGEDYFNHYKHLGVSSGSDDGCDGDEFAVY